jgi:chromosome segregation ATPase
MTYDPDAARQELQEAQFRIAELSTALELMREDRDAKKDSADSLWEELQLVRSQLQFAEKTIRQLRFHIEQGFQS